MSDTHTDGGREDNPGSCDGRRLSISSTRTNDTQTGSKGGLLRKRSSLRNIAGSLISMRRASKAFGVLAGPISKVPEKPVPKMENTYKMHPDEGSEFNSVKAARIIQDVLNKYIGKNQYDHTRASKMVQEMSSIIKARVKDLNNPRYKLVCNVLLVENKCQGLHDTSQCVWDTSTDNSACATFRNDTLLVVGTVHAVYYE